jgi:hypothetical protein
MANLLRRPQPARKSARRRQRARILASLIGVCQGIEQLKLSREARRACREVAGLLDSARAREENPPGRK